MTMRTNLRILHLLDDVEEVGNGIINAAIDIAAGQCDLGQRVAIASSGGSYVPLLESLGIQHFILDQNFRSPSNVIRLVPSYRHVVDEFRPQIVHCHMKAGMLTARFVPAGRPLHLVSHVHNIHEKSSTLMGLAERVISVSGSVADSMSAHGVPQDKLKVVMNGTIGSPRLPLLSSSVPVELQHPAIVTVAGMYERKGIADLIDAFEMIAADFPSTQLYLVGDGCGRAQFEARSAESPVGDRIHFLGFVKDPRPYLLAADVFVLASHRDSCPLVILEAREAGCPIIATHVDGIPEQLDSGAAGLLIPPKDSGALASALRSLLNDDTLRRRWGERARQGCERFNIKTMAQAVLNVYGELERQ